jgi:hypothetical protein
VVFAVDIYIYIYLYIYIFELGGHIIIKVKTYNYTIIQLNRKKKQTIIQSREHQKILNNCGAGGA